MATLLLTGSASYPLMKFDSSTLALIGTESSPVPFPSCSQINYSNGFYYGGRTGGGESYQFASTDIYTPTITYGPPGYDFDHPAGDASNVFFASYSTKIMSKHAIDGSLLMSVSPPISGYGGYIDNLWRSAINDNYFFVGTGYGGHSILVLNKSDLSFVTALENQSYGNFNYDIKADNDYVYTCTANSTSPLRVWRTSDWGLQLNVLNIDAKVVCSDENYMYFVANDVTYSYIRLYRYRKSDFAQDAISDPIASEYLGNGNGNLMFESPPPPVSAPVLISVIQGAKKNTLAWTWSA